MGWNIFDAKGVSFNHDTAKLSKGLCKYLLKHDLSSFKNIFAFQVIIQLESSAWVSIPQPFLR